MKAMVLDAFLLIMIFSRISFISTLDPPEDITVSCHNFQTEVHWIYKHNILQPWFKLYITSESNKFVKETKENHYDLTNDMWPFSPLDRYVVSVTAVVGTEASPSVESPIFTFNDVKTADVKCVLEFPPFDLSVNERGIKVSFTNPWFSYEKLEKFPLPDKVLTYQVLTSQVLTDSILPEILTCTISTCKSEVVLQSTNGSYCVQLNGWINGLENGGRILLNKTAPKCIRDSMHLQLQYTYILLGVLMVVFMAAGVVVLIMVYKFKAWKAKTCTLPKALDTIPTNSDYKKIMQVTKETVDGCFSVYESANDDQSGTTCCSSDSLDVPTGCSLFAEDQQQTGLVDMEMNEHSGSSIEEDEEALSSGYDRVHNLELLVEMAPNDMVTGYGHY